MSTVWRVNITLRHVEPPVWRTILVRPDTSLFLFHRFLNIAVGWEERHLFAFEIGGRTFMLPDPEISRSKKLYDPRRYTLERVFPALPGHGIYTYDFGDRWEHDFAITGAEDAVYRKQYPICVDGDGECPPEDCGGPPGYEFLQKNGGLERYGRRRSFWTTGATWDLRDVRRGLR